MKRRHAMASFLLGSCLVVTACNNDKVVEEKKLSPVDKLPNFLELDENSKEGKLINAGHDMMIDTKEMLPKNVGNKLSCASCHAGAGQGEALTLVGVTQQFPQYRDREGKISTIEDRVNGCFERSMNGTKLKEDSHEMKAIVAYLEFISSNVKKGEKVPWYDKKDVKDLPVPNVKNGEKLFNQKNCMSCHGKSGYDASYVGPALWGDGSFNDGAGLSRYSKMYKFVRNYMPFDKPGSLSDQEAADVVGYVLSQDRPEFKKGQNDYPKGGRPDDHITKPIRDAIKAGKYDWTEQKAVKKQ